MAEQTPSWWNDVTIPAKKLARKRLKYALESDDPLLVAEARVAAAGGDYPRARTASDPFSEEGITAAREMDRVVGERHAALAQQEAERRAGIQYVQPPPDETLIKAPEKTVVRTTRKLPETSETAQVPVVRRGRRNNGPIRRTIPDVDVGIAPEHVSTKQTVKTPVHIISPFTGTVIPAQPGTPIRRPTRPMTPVPEGFYRNGPLPTVEQREERRAARRGILAAQSTGSAQAALGPMPTLPPPQEVLPMHAGETVARIVPPPALPRLTTTGINTVANNHAWTRAYQQLSGGLPGATTQQIRLPQLPGARNRQRGVQTFHSPSPPIVQGYARALQNQHTVPMPVVQRPAQPPIAQPPAQNAQPASIPIINQQAAQAQIPQPARVQHASIYGVNPGILLFAGLSLVAVNFIGQAANTGASFADLLLHAPTSKTRGIFQALPANTFGTLLAETALVLFLALILGNINSFTNFLATGIIALFWLVWLIENGYKLTTIWQTITGSINSITKGGSKSAPPQTFPLPGGF